MLSSDPQMIVIQKGETTLKFRKNLFWDIPLEKLDLEKNKRIIIERVFSRGNLEEFKQLINYYSKNDIIKHLGQIKNFDKKTYNFIHEFYNLK